MPSDNRGGRRGGRSAPKTPGDAPGGIDDRLGRARGEGDRAGRESFPCGSCSWPRRPLSGTSVCEADEICWNERERVRIAVMKDEDPQRAGKHSLVQGERERPEGAVRQAAPLAEDPKPEVPPEPRAPGVSAPAPAPASTSREPQPRTPTRAENFPGAPFPEGCEACGEPTEFMIVGVRICESHQDVVIDAVRDGRDLPWRKLRVRRA